MISIDIGKNHTILISISIYTFKDNLLIKNHIFLLIFIINECRVFLKMRYSFFWF